ncbi:MAG: preprotein translocase subunit SecD, partial [Methanomicrobiales archaeon]
MNGLELKALVSDWRVATLIILILLSVVAIFPHFDSQRNMVSNLQYGLDLQQGSWLQLEFRAEVVGFTTDRPVDEFIANLSKKLDTEVVYIDPTHLEIRKYYSQAELDPIFTVAGGKLTTYQPGVSKSTSEDVKRILENKINTLGTKDAKVNTLVGLNKVARYIRVELAGVDMKQAQNLIGKQGKFEIRVMTAGNQSEHVLFGDAITSVQNPTQEPAGSNHWG